MKFQNPSFNFFLERTDGRTSQKQYAPHFFKVGGIKMDLFLRNIFFSIKMVSLNQLTSVKILLGVPLVGLLTLMGTSLSKGLPHFLSFH